MDKFLSSCPCPPCLAYWALFGSLVPTTCNCTSCTHAHELAQNHCGDKWLIIVIIVCWRIDSFFFFAKKAIYSFRGTKAAFTSSKLAAETPKVPNLLKVSNKNIQVSKCSKMFFSGTSIDKFEHTFAFKVKHLTVIYAYFFYHIVNLQASKDCIKSYMVSVQSLYCISTVLVFFISSKT